MKPLLRKRKQERAFVRIHHPSKRSQKEGDDLGMCFFCSTLWTENETEFTIERMSPVLASLGCDGYYFSGGGVSGYNNNKQTNKVKNVLHTHHQGIHPLSRQYILHYLFINTFFTFSSSCILTHISVSFTSNFVCQVSSQ